MKVEMCLATVDAQWKGLVRIEGEMFKVTLWPGSMTEGWKALLQPTLFVELTEGGTLSKVIEEEWKEMLLRQNLTKYEMDSRLTLVNVDEGLLKEIVEGLKGKRGG